MKTHLQTTSTLLFIVTLATGVYFEPVATLVTLALLFTYTAVYAEFKQIEEQKENGEDTRTTEGDI